MADRRSLYVQNIPTDAPTDNMTEAIWNAFIIFGDINKVTLSDTKETCLVEFETEEDATAALDNMHLSELFGQPILVSYATKGNLHDKSKAIWSFNGVNT